MKKLLLGSIALLAPAIGGSAWAADIPRKAPPPAPAPAAEAAVSWTGCYLGGNIGGGWGLKDWANPSEDLDKLSDNRGDRGTAALGGFVGGGQIGCDYQPSGAPWVVGIQGMFEGTDISGNITDLQNPDFDLTTRINWFAAVMGRLGYALVPNGLLYFKGGVAWVRDHHLVLDLGAPFELADVTRTAWTLGGGFEYMFLPNWSIFAEYDYMGFGTKTIPFGFPNGSFSETWDIRQNVQAVLVGLNYRFSFGKTPAPVVAKY
jgi:outer membrane immunogenic protein